MSTNNHGKLRLLELKEAQPYDTLKIGIDVSVDATGMCMIFGKTVALFKFTPHLPPEDDSSDDVNFVQFNKIYLQTSSSARERSKMHTRHTLANKIVDAIDMFMQEIWPNSPANIQIVTEGSAYGYAAHNSNSLVELAEFRSVILERCYHRWPLGTHLSLDVIAPKSLKKHATGDGKADKLKMIEAAIAKLTHIHWAGKIDDECDALHLCLYEPLSNPEPRLW